MIKSILYIFGGEVASGAEIVTERLIQQSDFRSHLFIAPGDFSTALLSKRHKYVINIVPRLKRLNRNNTSPFVFYLKALINYIIISFITWRYIKKHKINAIHCNTLGQACYLLPLVILSPIVSRNLKCVWTDHDLKYYFPIDNFLAIVCSRLYHRTFVVSEAVKKKYKRGKVSVLYNGLNCNQFKPDLTLRKQYRAKLKLNDDAIVIGNAGVMSMRKGQLNLIYATERLRYSNKDIYLLLAGKFGYDELAYNEEIKNAVDSRHIIYVGQIDDMVSFYNACDIIVSNSDIKGSEPLGTTIYEAMACEKVVIASDTGGTAEIIDDQINGYLFTADNIQSLTFILNTVIDNFDKQQSITKAARLKVIDRFNISNVFTNYRWYMASQAD
jgi:glycosyltransferase involved in cell wall biosynthesis